MSELLWFFAQGMSVVTGAAFGVWIMTTLLDALYRRNALKEFREREIERVAEREEAIRAELERNEKELHGWLTAEERARHES